ncbi:MAG: hypothetical protein ACKOEX_07665 [Planctomycetia bacterium]
MPLIRTTRSYRLFAMLVASCAAAHGLGVAHAQEPLPPPPAPAPVPVPDAPPLYLAEPEGPASLPGFPRDAQPALVAPWPQWFAGASGLVMTRTLPAGTTSVGPGGLTFNTADASASWPGGVDLRVGRWFGPEQHHAIEMIYWGVYNIGSTTSATSGGTTGTLQRSDLINDVEINWLYSLGQRPEYMPPNRSVNLMWLAGFRFFELQDVLTLQSGGTDLNVATNNNLFGGQVGAKFDWRFAPRLRFSAVPKFLMAGNSISNTSTLDGSNVASSLGVFSWLGSVDTSVNWDVTDRWSLWIGYRVVGVGNISQADQQWPQTIPPAAGDLSGITAGSESIIHGGFAGFEARY